MALRAASDISLVPSLEESFGLVAMEALLFGQPVVSTGVGGLSQFLKPFTNKTPLVVRKSTVESFDRDVKQCLEGLVWGNAKDICWKGPRHTPFPHNAVFFKVESDPILAVEQMLTKWGSLTDEQKDQWALSNAWHALTFSWLKHGGALDQYEQMYNDVIC